MTTIIILIGLGLYVALYYTYGKKVERDVVKANDSAETPAKRLFDGIDFVPARREVLLGHHFASIAGAAPIVGPAIAMAWGWVPGLLWVWFGNIFVGAIHDYLALMASIRYDGKSIQFVASDLMGKRTGKSFYGIVFVLLLLIVAAFSAIVGKMFVADGAIASAFLWLIVAAVIFGFLVYRTKTNYTLATLIGLGMVVASVWLGVVLPVQASYDTWLAAFFVYIIVASALPVNLLLQPRDYLNSFLLYAGLAIGLVAAVFAVGSFEVPAFSSFAPTLIGGQPTPFWPAIPLVIACGALSGFHSLVASGTTSKQISRESDALPIGMGSMFLEGFLSTIVIVSIAGFGYTAIKNAGVAMNVPIDLTAENWSTTFTSASTSVQLSQANLFIQSYSDMIASTWLGFIPAALVTVLAGMWVSSFAMTTLDTANRLGRYCMVEICAPLQERNASLYWFLTNRWVASLVPAAVGIYLAWSGNWLIVWGAAGAANQLIAAIALMTGAAYVAKRLKSRFSNVALVPALLLWITVFCGSIWMLVVVMPGEIASNPGAGWPVTVMISVMVIFNIVFILDFLKAYFGKEAPAPADTVKV